jgi:hypothetical protein
MLLDNEGIDTLVFNLLKGVRLHHPQACGVHFEQRTIRSEKLYTFGFGFENGTEMRLAGGEFALLSRITVRLHQAF